MAAFAEELSGKIAVVAVDEEEASRKRPADDAETGLQLKKGFLNHVFLVKTCRLTLHVFCKAWKFAEF